MLDLYESSTSKFCMIKISLETPLDENQKIEEIFVSKFERRNFCDSPSEFAQILPFICNNLIWYLRYERYELSQWTFDGQANIAHEFCFSTVTASSSLAPEPRPLQLLTSPRKLCLEISRQRRWLYSRKTPITVLFLDGLISRLRNLHASIATSKFTRYIIYPYLSPLRNDCVNFQWCLSADVYID